MILARHSTTRHTDFICIPFCACCICLYLANAPFLSTLEILRAGCRNALQCFKAFSYFFDVVYLSRFFFFGVRFLYFSAGGKKKGLPSLLGSIKVFPELIYLCHKVEAYYFLVRSQNSTDAMKNGAQTFLRTKRFVFFFFCFLKMVEKCDYSRE